MPRQRSIQIQLDRPRNLRFGWKANAAFERETGISVLEALAKMGEEGKKNQGLGIKLSHLLALLWAGLIHEDKTLTIDQVGDILDELNDGVMPALEKFQGKLSEAVIAGLGGDEAKKKLSEISLEKDKEASQEETKA